VIVIVVGLVLETTVLSRASTAGSNVVIGSFSGAQSLNDLVPLIYKAAVVMLGVGMMAIGAAGFAGRGPMGVAVAVKKIISRRKLTRAEKKNSALARLTKKTRKQSGP